MESVLEEALAGKKKQNKTGLFTFALVSHSILIAAHTVKTSCWYPNLFCSAHLEIEVLD